MCAEQPSALEMRQQTLRSELKIWERTFVEANGGRKAGKEDIKNNPEIGKQLVKYCRQKANRLAAAKYKEYNKLRTRISDVSTESTASTPKKSRKHRIETQEDVGYHTAQHPALIDPYDIPQHMLSTPKIIRTVIGPTPQKNGQVLGLFDMLSPSSTRTATPSKSIAAVSGPVINSNTMQTPSKRRSSNHVSTIGHLEATPSGSSKRRCIGSTQTPSVQRQRALTNLTPSSNRLNMPEQIDPDQTPAFLKRVSDPSIFTNLTTELGTDIAYPPPSLRLRRKPVGRSLSQLVRSLREQEDQRLDDELALMREIETGETTDRTKAVTQDNQPGDLPLGADGEHELTEQELSNKENESKTLWRKKGQKRTTRRANIGVNKAKWKPETEWQCGHESDGDSQDRVVETQSTDQDPNYKEQGESKPQHESTEQVATKDVSAANKQTARSKKPRKINPNAVAHANFRSLKIKNKNSKGRKGGRFGRR